MLRKAKPSPRTAEKTGRTVHTGQRQRPPLSDKTLYNHMGELARFIDETMRKLGELTTPLVGSTSHLPQASQALTDLVTLTEEGTHRVMDLTEVLLENHNRFSAGLKTIQVALSESGQDYAGVVAQAAGLSEMVAANQKALLDILTTLSFQDLVGQRIKKVVDILAEVQARLLELVVLFGEQSVSKDADKGRVVVLLKELEQAKASIKQDVVDELLKQHGF
jgi:chemotaxis protein CheZ